jgi:hypothetical protein
LLLWRTIEAGAMTTINLRRRLEAREKDLRDAVNRKPAMQQRLWKKVACPIPVLSQRGEVFAGAV